MKKTYIVPENTVVRLNVEQMVCISGPTLTNTSASTTDSAPSDIEEMMDGNSLAREVNTPDAWEEW